MSQHPPGYQSQFGYAASPYSDPLAPAKRAGTMMIVVGSLVLLLGLCMGLVVAMLTGPMSAQISQNFPPGITQEQVGYMLKLAMAFLLVAAIIEIVMGVFVRSGKSTPIVISLVLTVLATIYFVLNLVMIVRAGNATQIVVALTSLVICVAQLLLLVAAMKNAGNVQAARNAYHAQYWQYMQQQQAHQQGMAAPLPGYGAPQAYAPPVYGAHSYQAPPPPAGTAGGQVGWQWPAQPSSELPPLPAPLPSPTSASLPPPPAPPPLRPPVNPTNPDDERRA